MFSTIKTAIKNIQDKRLYNRVITYLEKGYSLVNSTKWQEFESKRYFYKELGIDHYNYEIVDLDNNLVEYVPGYVVDMLPENQYRKIEDTCKIGNFCRIELILEAYDNMTYTEAQYVFNRFENSVGIDRARLRKLYPNLLADYQDEHTTVLAYDKDCQPTKQQVRNMFYNSLVQRPMYNQDSTQQKYYINN